MRRITIAIVLILTAAMSCAFADKITVDPNAAGQLRPAEDIDKPDSRLAQKITYQAARKTVSSILADLTKLTGVTLKAGINENDWQVRDRKMNIFAKDTSLKDIMDSVGRVMKFQWASGGKGDTRTYRIFMDRKTLLDAESKRLREEQKHEQMISQKREKTLKEFSAAGELSEAELEKLKTEKPFMYLAATIGLSPALGALFRDAPMAVDALASGRQLTLMGSDLSPSAQKSLLQAANAMVSLESSLGIGGDSMPGDIAANMGKLTVLFNKNMDMVKTTPAANILLGEISIRYGDKTYDVPFINPQSQLADAFAKAAIKSKEEGRPFEEVMQEMQAEMSGAFLEMVRDTNLGEEAIKHPDDPKLDEKIKIKPKRTTLDGVQQALQDASKLAVVSDSFGSGQGLVAAFDIQGEIQIKKLLQVISDGCGYNWEKHDNVLEFRDRDWYRKRAAQIPQGWIDGWKKALKDTGTLDIADLAQIAALTPEQLEVNVTSDECLATSRVPWAVLGTREMLKLYGCLTEGQRSAILTDKGLNLRNLTPQQWPLAESLIKQRNAAFLQNPDAQLTLSASRRSIGKGFVYSFKLSTSEDMPAITLAVTTPEYREPEKETQDKNKTEDKAKETAPAK